MLKIKLIILGLLLSLTAAYSSPIATAPIITNISNVTSTGFTVHWSPCIVSGLAVGSSYYATYTITVSGPSGYSTSTSSTSARFSGLLPSSSYSIMLSTSVNIIGEIGFVSVPIASFSAKTAEAPISDINEVSTDYTKSSSQSVILKAKTRIVLKTGFRYQATTGYSLVTQLVPNAKSSDIVENDILYPETSYLDTESSVSLGNVQVSQDYEITQPLRSCILIKNKNSDCLVGYYEIIEMNLGEIATKGRLYESDTQIDIAHLKQGFYVVKVMNGKYVQTQKIVIKH